MDLSIFDTVFGLRDKARKAQLDSAAAEEPKLPARGDGERVVAAPKLPNSDVVEGLVKSVVKLDEAKRSDDGAERTERAAITDLLHAALAPLRAFDESDLGVAPPSDSGAGRRASAAAPVVRTSANERSATRAKKPTAKKTKRGARPKKND